MAKGLQPLFLFQDFYVISVLHLILQSIWVNSNLILIWKINFLEILDAVAFFRCLRTGKKKERNLNLLACVLYT